MGFIQQKKQEKNGRHHWGQLSQRTGASHKHTNTTQTRLMTKHTRQKDPGRMIVHILHKTLNLANISHPHFMYIFLHMIIASHFLICIQVFLHFLYSLSIFSNHVVVYIHIINQSKVILSIALGDRACFGFGRWFLPGNSRIFQQQSLFIFNLFCLTVQYYLHIVFLNQFSSSPSSFYLPSPILKLHHESHRSQLSHQEEDVFLNLYKTK